MPGINDLIMFSARRRCWQMKTRLKSLTGATLFSVPFRLLHKLNVLAFSSWNMGESVCVLVCVRCWSTKRHDYTEVIYAQSPFSLSAPLTCGGAGLCISLHTFCSSAWHYVEAVKAAKIFYYTHEFSNSGSDFYCLTTSRTFFSSIDDIHRRSFSLLVL